MQIELTSVDAVIGALGGLKEVASLTGRRGNSAVPMWRQRGSFPSNTYAVMIAALQEQGKTAPASLWGMKQPEVAS